MVVLDIEDENLENRIKYYEKMQALEKVLRESYLSDAVYEDSFILENGKELSRIYVLLTGVSIHNKNTWQETMEFLYKHMNAFEDFFEDFKDYLKA